LFSRHRLSFSGKSFGGAVDFNGDSIQVIVTPPTKNAMCHANWLTFDIAVVTSSTHAAKNKTAMIIAVLFRLVRFLVSLYQILNGMTMYL
jgi:hypothetical protein